VLPRPDNVSENLELQTWSSTMDELELQAIPSEERQRQEAIFELIATERTYLNDLQLIVNVGNLFTKNAFVLLMIIGILH
jgi:hypothetical protein